MNRTFTPTLPPGVLPRLEAYADIFRPDFPMARQADWSLVYLRGLLQDGERKSIEPMVARVDLPPQLRVKNPDQCLQNFVNQADWDDLAVAKRYRSHLAQTFADPAASFVIDDTTFPKKGEHSVGVKHQYCGALGKQANCQAAVSVHYVTPKGHYPLAMELYLPQEWAGDADRLEKAHVPESMRAHRTKGQIALALLDRVRSEGLAGRVVVADAGYGISGEFRDGLAARGMDYVVGVTSELVVFPGRAALGQADPLAAGEAGDSAPPGRGGAASGEPGRAGQGIATRGADLAARDQGGVDGPIQLDTGVAGGGWATGDCAGADPVWLLIEEETDGTLKYALSNLPAETAMARGWRRGRAAGRWSRDISR